MCFDGVVMHGFGPIDIPSTSIAISIQIAFRFFVGVSRAVARICAAHLKLLTGQANSTDLAAIICLGAMGAASITEKFIFKSVGVCVHDLTVTH